MYAASPLVINTYVVLLRAEGRLKNVEFLEKKGFIPDLHISDGVSISLEPYYSHDSARIKIPIWLGSDLTCTTDSSGDCKFVMIVGGTGGVYPLELLRQRAALLEKVFLGMLRQARLSTSCSWDIRAYWKVWRMERDWTWYLFSLFLLRKSGPGEETFFVVANCNWVSTRQIIKLPQ